MNSIKKTALASLCALISLTAATSNAHAYVITMSTANQNGATFLANSTATGFAPSIGGSPQVIKATFNYSGPLSFNDSASQNSSSSGDLNANFFNAGYISNYHGSGTLSAPANANFNGLSNFLASSGSASGYQYGSFFTIDMGVLAAGTILTISHDDGASVYQRGNMVGSTTITPTTLVTESVKLTSTSDTILYYARENGTPSVLDVKIPEPATMTLLGVGMIGTGLIARRRRQSTTTPTAG